MYKRIISHCALIKCVPFSYCSERAIFEEDFWGRIFVKTNKEINLGGKTYEFTYEEKNVKNINIRFTLEKGLSVSAPFGTDYAYVEKLLIENKMKVISSFEEIEKARKGTTANNTKEKKRKSCDNVTVTLPSRIW